MNEWRVGWMSLLVYNFCFGMSKVFIEVMWTGFLLISLLFPFPYNLQMHQCIIFFHPSLVTATWFYTTGLLVKGKN